MNVSAWDRLHFHPSCGVRSIAGLSVRILFGTPLEGKILLADSTVWFEDTVSERERSFETPGACGGTGFVMSVPVVAPLLNDVILRNRSGGDMPAVYVTLLA